MKTFKEYINEKDAKEYTRIIVKEEPSDDDYDKIIDLTVRNGLVEWESGATSDYKNYEFISNNSEDIKSIQTALKDLGIKILKIEVDKPQEDLKKLRPDAAIKKIYNSVVGQKNWPGADERWTYKFGTANGSIWIESDYNASEIADFNKKETYLGLTYAEVVAICKSSKKAVQAKKRK